MNNLKNFSKKELKDYVNKNWFYFHFNCDKIEANEAMEMLKSEKNLLQTWVSIPENDDIIIYKGIASQHYDKWEKSRNWYKYNQKGWKFDNYLLNPIVLFQHDTDKPIGHSLAFWWGKDKHLKTMFFIYKEALEWVERVRVEKWLIKAISTWAISNDYWFEDSEDWKILTEEEASEKYSWNDVFRAYEWNSEKLTLYIKEAEVLEESLVTIGSNEKALAITNWIAKFGETKLEELKAKLEMNKVEEKKETEEIKTENNEVENNDIEEPTETVETPNEEEEEKEVVEKESVETESVETETKDEVETKDEAETLTTLEDNNETTKAVIIVEPEESTENEKEIKEDEFSKILDWKMSEIKNSIEGIKSEFIGNETFTDSIEKILQENKVLTDNVKQLSEKIEEIEKCNELLVDTLENLTKRLQNTIFDSGRFFSREEEKPKSSLSKKIELIKNNI